MNSEIKLKQKLKELLESLSGKARQVPVGQVLGLICVFVLVMGFRYGTEGHASIKMQMHVSKADQAQWYFDSGNGYSEQESKKVDLVPGLNAIHFDLPAGSYRQLRFDPVRGDQKVEIHEVSLQPAASVVSGGLELRDFNKGNDVVGLRLDGGVLVVTNRIGTADPQLIVSMQAPLQVVPVRNSWASSLLLASLMTMLLGVGCWVLSRTPLQHLIVVFIALALVMIMSMGAVSPVSLRLHPDERLHIVCFEHFLSHFWPPAADSKEIVPSLLASPWGISYLNSYDIVYFLSGNLMSPLQDVIGSSGGAARAFQYLLWIVMFLMAVFRKTWALALGVLILSPQVWYVFSYFNGDAFPLFLSMIAVALMSEPGGSVNRYIDHGKWGGGAIAFAMCIAGLLVSKANFYPAVLGIMLWLCVSKLQLRWIELLGVLIMAGCAGTVSMLGDWHEAGGGYIRQWLIWCGVLAAGLSIGCGLWRYRQSPGMRIYAHRIFCLAVLSLVIAMPRIANDLWINGSPAQKSTIVANAQEAYAKQDFKPSSIESNRAYERLRFADRGISLSEMLTGEWRWGSKSLKSSFGTYGYMSVWSPNWLYWVQICAFGGLILAISFFTYRHESGNGGKKLGIVLGISLLVILSSILYSWLYSFQPQGRYLLPVLPMVGLLLVTAYKPGESAIKPMLMVMALLSMVSFVWIGLPGISAKV